MSYPTPTAQNPVLSLLTSAFTRAVCFLLAAATICHAQQFNFKGPGSHVYYSGSDFDVVTPEYQSTVTVDATNGTTAIQLSAHLGGTAKNVSNTLFPKTPVVVKGDGHSELSVTYTLRPFDYTLDIPATRPQLVAYRGVPIGWFTVPVPEIPATLTMEYSYTFAEDGKTIVTGTGAYNLTGSINPNIYFGTVPYPTWLGMVVGDYSAFYPSPGPLTPLTITGTYGTFSVPQPSLIVQPNYSYLSSNGTGQPSSVPEPSTLGIGSSLGLVAWVFIRKQRRACV
jgi:hypothetical protein